jgi:hypothetical protein
MKEKKGGNGRFVRRDEQIIFNANLLRLFFAKLIGGKIRFK